MIPDNYSAYESYECEQDRLDRRYRREVIEEEMEPEDMPFYEEEL